MDGEGKGPRGKNTQNASEQLQFAEGASKGQRGSREFGNLLKLLVPQSMGLEGMLWGTHRHPPNPGWGGSVEPMGRPVHPLSHAAGRQTGLPHRSSSHGPGVFEGLSSLPCKRRVLPALQGSRAECLAIPAKAFRPAPQKPCTVPRPPARAPIPLTEADTRLDAGSLL